MKNKNEEKNEMAEFMKKRRAAMREDSDDESTLSSEESHNENDELNRPRRPVFLSQTSEKSNTPRAETPRAQTPKAQREEVLPPPPLAQEYRIKFMFEGKPLPGFSDVEPAQERRYYFKDNQLTEEYTSKNGKVVSQSLDNEAAKRSLKKLSENKKIQKNPKMKAFFEGELNAFNSFIESHLKVGTVNSLPEAPKPPKKMVRFAEPEKTKNSNKSPRLGE